MPFLLVPNYCHCILSLPDSERLEILTIHNDVVSDVIQPWSMDAMYTIDDTTVTADNDLKDWILSDPRYKALFSGIGCLPEEVNLQVDKTITPHAAPPRKNAISLHRPLDKELNYLLKQGTLVKLNESKASEWVNSYACVKKPNGSIRVCIDPRLLNKAIIRPGK